MTTEIKSKPITYFKLKPSFSQERFWVLHNLEPHKPTYNISKVFRFHGNLKLEAWKKSLEELIERHEILRTSFIFEEELFQLITSNTTPSFDYLELLEGEAREVINDFIHQPFDIECDDSLFKAKIIKTELNVYYFALNIHHILCDGPSLGILIKDLFSLYNHKVSKTALTLPELDIQFADFAEWERSLQEETSYKESLEFWKENLKDAPAKVNFNKHGTAFGFNGKTSRFILPSELQQFIREISKSNRTTVFTTLLTAFKVLINKYTSQNEVSIGSPVSLRENKQLKNVIGLFINTVVINSKIDPHTSFSDNVNHIQANVFECFKHKYIPYDLIVKEISPDREDINNSLFNIMFALHYATDKPKLEGIKYDEIRLDNSTSKFDLSLSIIIEDDRMGMEVEYNTKIFNENYIKQMFGHHFMTLLANLSNNENKPLKYLEIMTEEEQNNILLNNIKKEMPPRKCIHELFEDRVAVNPQAIALTFREQTLTYFELNQKCNKLAGKLKHKIESGSPIGIYMDRSMEMIISIITVLKMGGVYVPLNIEDPPKRTINIIKKANVIFVLSNKDSKDKLKKFINIESYSFNESDLPIDEFMNNPSTKTTPESMLSIYFTSGSTGEPKGVINHHIGWINRMNCMQQTHHLQVGDSVLQKTLYTFDAFGLEVFWPLLFGGNVCLLEAGEHRNPRSIIDAMIKHKVIFLQVVPSMLNEIVRELKKEDLSCLSRHLKFIASAGEPLTSSLYRSLIKKIDCPVYNTWGPTEASIDVTQYLCREEDQFSDEIISIGTPMMNNEVYILDENLNPVPVYVTGDIYVSGIGLSKGYVNDQEKTSASFINNPFKKDTIMYRTGDKGYFLEDGNIKFVGREDNQIKLRGIRVELDEIERVINNSKLVNQGVVKVINHNNNYKLIAYISLISEHSSAMQEVKEELTSKLPMYMLPNHYEEMKSLPLLSNGKIDRKSLPIPNLSTISQSKLVLPRTNKELIICRLMSNLLGHNQIGINSNFFDIGGHSLNAFKLLNSINQEFKINLPLSFIFKNSTIEKMCKVIENRRCLEVEKSNIILLQNGDVNKAPLFLIHPGGGGIICYYEFVRKMNIENPIYGIQSLGYDDNREPLKSIKHMAEEYIKGIVKVQPTGPYILAGWSLGGTIAFEIAHQLEKMHKTVDFLGLIDTYPIDSMKDSLKVAQSRKTPIEAWATRLNISFDTDTTQKEKIKLIHSEVKNRKMIPLESTINETNKILEVMYCNNMAAEDFYCDYYLNHNIHLFNVNELSHINPIPLVDANVWRERTTKKLFIHEIDGDHHNLMDKSKVSKLANTFKTLLEDRR
ncbi:MULTISPECIES: amino acid adenylation domain-containing protein [unclassified Lysinibacillus]|uniref:non-ribosomal peptide synthetase n=1 Tax=unclassified Lysinibacillus TaxID=2636778 RepID=UPI0038087DCD